MKVDLKQKTRKRKKTIGINNGQLWIMMSIPLLMLFIFNYLPMGGIMIAFKNFRYDKGIFGSDWVGFKNFEFFFRSNDFFVITRNTLVLNFIFIICGIASAVIVAILFYELKSRTKTKIFQTIFITPHFLSWVVVSYMVYAILQPQNGMLNSVLKSMGIDPVNWYSRAEPWPLILTIVSIWKHVGMDAVVYYAALMGMDSALFEAAEVDGATKGQIIRKIIIPLMVPLISILTILKIGNIFRADFGLFYQVTRDSGELYAITDVIDTYVYRTMRVTGNMGLSSAVGLLQSVVGIILVTVTNYLSGKIDADNKLF